MLILPVTIDRRESSSSSFAEDMKAVALRLERARRWRRRRRLMLLRNLLVGRRRRRTPAEACAAVAAQA